MSNCAQRQKTWPTRFVAGAPIAVLMLLTSCGSPRSPTSSTTSAPTVAPTTSQAATPTPTPATTAAATVDQLTAVAVKVYTACTPATCAGNAMFTTCAAGASGSDVFASCPLTSRLVAQLQQDVAGVPSAPDPLGGGQDPAWATRTATATPSATGGIVHVTLGFGPGSIMDRLDLVVVIQGGQLLVDDLYCTGTDPNGNDAFASGWLSRSVCTS